MSAPTSAEIALTKAGSICIFLHSNSALGNSGAASQCSARGGLGVLTRNPCASICVTRRPKLWEQEGLRPRAKTPDIVQLIFYLHLVIVFKTPDAAHVQFYPPLRNACHSACTRPNSVPLDAQAKAATRLERMC